MVTRKFRVWARRFVLLVGALTVAAVIGFGLFSAAKWFVRWSYTDEFMRGFYLVTALNDWGGPIPFDPRLTDEPVTRFGIQTNSEWALDYTLRIVPLFAYEGIVESTTYPAAVGFFPFPGDGAYTVWGRAWPADRVAFVNWRFTEDPTMSDEAEALGTLVHELLHVQGGIFAEGSSAELESATSAATVEVLAAMCNFGDEVACRAFLQDLQSGVRAVLIRDLSFYRSEWVYQTYSDIFLRDGVNRLIAEKSLRYWSHDPGARMEIIRKYGVVPLEQYIGPGIRGASFSTAGNGYEGAPYYFVTGIMGSLVFDDTWIALHRLRGPFVLALVATYGGQK